MIEFIVVGAALTAAGGLLWLALWAGAVAAYLLLDLARAGLTLLCDGLRWALIRVGGVPTKAP